MSEECQTIQIFQKVIEATIPIITTVIGAIIDGIATYKTAKWQIKRGEKHEYASIIAATTLELQTTTASNFLFYEQNNPELIP